MAQVAKVWRKRWGVAAGHVGGATAAAEQLLEAVGLEPYAGPQLAGPGEGPHERARRRPADGEVGLERGLAAAGEGDDALLVALAVANQQAAGVRAGDGVWFGRLACARTRRAACTRSATDQAGWGNTIRGGSRSAGCFCGQGAPEFETPELEEGRG